MAMVQLKPISQGIARNSRVLKKPKHTTYMRKIFLWGNNVFLPIERDVLMSSNFQKETMYIRATIGGDIMSTMMYTEEEIKAKCPNIKEVKSLHGLCKAWGDWED